MEIKEWFEATVYLMSRPIELYGHTFTFFQLFIYSTIAELVLLLLVVLLKKGD